MKPLMEAPWRVHFIAHSSARRPLPWEIGGFLVARCSDRTELLNSPAQLGDIVGINNGLALMNPPLVVVVVVVVAAAAVVVAVDGR